MTEKKVIDVVLLLEGTNNNRRRDAKIGQESNVARVGDLLKTDYSFDVSKGLEDNPAFAHNLEEMDDGTIGNRDALAQFIKSGDFSSRTISLYYDGVGSHDEDSLVTRALEGGFGAGMKDRVKYLVKVINEFHKADPDVEIRISIIGGSRGGAEGKDLLNEFGGQEHDFISVNRHGRASCLYAGTTDANQH